MLSYLFRFNFYFKIQNCWFHWEKKKFKNCRASCNKVTILLNPHLSVLRSHIKSGLTESLTQTLPQGCWEEWEGWQHNGAEILQDKQQQMALPSHNLIQDVSTWWNSSCDMLLHFLEQWPAVFTTLRSGECRKAEEVNILKQNDIVKVMAPVKVVTTILCEDEQPAISVIAPLTIKGIWWRHCTHSYKHNNSLDTKNKWLQMLKVANIVLELIAITISILWLLEFFLL